MNIISILEEIEKVDGDVYQRLSPRRKAMKSFFNMGSKIALATVPLALGSMFKKAYGATPEKVLEVLNFALTLEHLEYNFYKKAVDTPGLIPSGIENMREIRDNELAHVRTLQATITQLGGTPVAEAMYDFTAKGTFPTVFSSYVTFLAVAQAFEDTGVRAYKGQAGELLGSPGVLSAALRIHSVEARHAAHIRYTRRIAGHLPTLKPWITGGNDSGVPQVAAVYAGEENVVQAGITIININGKMISADAASASFDEPLTKEQVLAIVKPFFA